MSYGTWDFLMSGGFDGSLGRAPRFAIVAASQNPRYEAGRHCYGVAHTSS